MFLMLFTFVSAFHKRLFSNWQKILVYTLIGLSVFSGSRGGIFSSLLFVLGWMLIKQTLVWFYYNGSGFVSYQLVMNFVEIVTYLTCRTISTGDFRYGFGPRGGGRGGVAAHS